MKKQAGKMKKRVPPRTSTSAKSRAPTKKTPSRPSITLSKAIRSGFADDEIPDLLAHLLVMLDQPTVERFADSLGPKHGQTLREVLAVYRSTRKETTKGKASPDPPLGPGRARQEWEEAWTDWRAVIEETNDEHGAYVRQEHHWEAPYFCPDDVSEALEPIAKRMRPLIPKVIEAPGVDQDFSFLEALKEDLDEIASGLDDWMGAWEGDGLGFGPEVTSCLFEAEWAWTTKNRGNLAEVVERIQEFDLTNKKAGLNDRAAENFLMNLPREEVTQLVTSVTRRPAAKCSPWWRAVCDRFQSKGGDRSIARPRRRVAKGAS